LLLRWREGSREAENELFALVLPDLRRLAHYLMKRERPDHSLQATELVDTVYLRLVKAKDRDWQNRKHFFAIAARAMRRYLVDHARGRPKAEIMAIAGFEEVIPNAAVDADVTLAIDRLLDELAETQPDWASLVELKYFLGLTDEEAAEAMGWKLRSMQRMWRDARQWLFERMESSSGRSTG
jgi:RNA polymerase sigma factor (TIGR02999 family)